MSKKKDKVRIYNIIKQLNEIKELIENKSLKEISEDTRTIHLIKISLLNIGTLVEHLSDNLKEKYSANEWGEMYNLRKGIERAEIDINGIWEVTSKNLSNFELLIYKIIKTEKYDFTEQNRLEQLKKIYSLADKYNIDNSYVCQEQPLREMNIPEISQDESKKCAKFKIEIISYGSEDEDEEYSVTEYLCLEDEGEWKQVLYSRIKARRIDYEHGKIKESLGFPFQRVMYVDIEDLVYYIENVHGTLHCSVDKIRWYRYNVKPENRPYYNRIDKLRKFKIPN